MKKTTVKLDPRPSRKLTSRECANVLGGFLGGMATSDLVGPEEARKALKLWTEGDEIWKILSRQTSRGYGETAGAVEEARSLQAGGADPGLRVFWRGLGAVISGLRVVSSERAVKIAVAWFYQRDDYWRLFKKAAPPPWPAGIPEGFRPAQDPDTPPGPSEIVFPNEVGLEDEDDLADLEDEEDDIPPPDFKKILEGFGG